MVENIENETSHITDQISGELMTTVDKINITIDSFKSAEETLETQLKWLEVKRKELYGNH